MNYGRNMPDWQQYNTLQSGENERPGIVQNTSHGHLFASGIGTSPLNGLNLNSDCLSKPQNEANFNIRNYQVPPPTVPNPMAHMPSCHYGTSGGIATTVDDARNGAGINVNNNITSLGQRMQPATNTVPNRQTSYPQCRLPCCIPEANMGYQLGNYQSNNPYRESVHAGYPVENRRYRGEINFRKDGFSSKDLMANNSFSRSYPDYKHRKDSAVPRNYPGQPTILPNYPVQNYNFPDYQKYPYNMKEYPKGTAVAQRNSGMMVNMQDKFLQKPAPYQGNIMPNTNIPPPMQSPYYNSQMVEKEATETTNRMQAPMHSKHQIYQQKFAMQRFTLENHLRELSRMPGYQTHPKYQECLLRYKELLRLQQTVEYQSTIQGSLNAIPPPVQPINLQFDQNGVLINSNFVPGPYPGLQNPLGTIQNPMGSKDPSVDATGACMQQQQQQQQPGHCPEQFIAQSQITDFQIHRTEEDNTEASKQKGSRDFADKPELDVRQFLANWDEEEDEDGIHTVNCQNVMLNNSTPVVVLEYGNLNVENNLANEATPKAVEMANDDAAKIKDDKPEDGVGRTVNIIRCITSNSDEIPTIHIVDALENDAVVKKIESALHNLTGSNIKSIEELVNKRNLDGKEEQVSLSFLSDLPAKELTTKISDSTKEAQQKNSSEKSQLGTIENSNPNPDEISLPDLPTSECTPISTTLNTPNHSDNEESSERVNMNNSMEIMPSSPIISFAHSPIKMDSFDHVDPENLGPKGNSNELQFDFQSNGSGTKGTQGITEKQLQNQPTETQNELTKSKPADMLFYSPEDLYPSNSDPPLCQISMPIVDTEEPKLPEPAVENNLTGIIQNPTSMSDLVLDTDKVDDIWGEMGIDCTLDSNGPAKDIPKKSAKTNDFTEITTKVPDTTAAVSVAEPKPVKVKPKTNRHSFESGVKEFWGTKRPKKRSRSVDQNRSSGEDQAQEQLLAEFRRLKRKRSIGQIQEEAEEIKMSTEDGKGSENLSKTLECFNAAINPNDKIESRKCVDSDIKIQLSNVNLRISDQKELQITNDNGREAVKDSHEGITIEINVSRVESQHSNATTVVNKANQQLNISLPTNPVTCKLDCRTSISREQEIPEIDEIPNKSSDEEHARRNSIEDKKFKSTKREKNVITFVNKNADIEFLEDPRRPFRNASPPPTDKCLTNPTDTNGQMSDEKRRNDIHSLKCSKPSSSRNTEIFRNHNFSDIDQMNGVDAVDLDFDSFNVPIYNKDPNFADDLADDSLKNPGGFLNPLFSNLEDLENLNTVPVYTTKDGKIKYSPNPKYTYRALILEAREKESRRKKSQKKSHSKSRKRHSMYLYRYKHENKSKKYNESCEYSDSDWPEIYERSKKTKEDPIIDEPLSADEKTKETCEHETKISEDSGVESTKPNETIYSPTNQEGGRVESEQEEIREMVTGELQTKDNAKMSESLDQIQVDVVDSEDQGPIVNSEEVSKLAKQDETHEHKEDEEMFNEVVEDKNDSDMHPFTKCTDADSAFVKQDSNKSAEEKDISKCVQSDEVSTYEQNEEMANAIDMTLSKSENINDIRKPMPENISKPDEENEILDPVADNETNSMNQSDALKTVEENEIIEPAVEKECLDSMKENEIPKSIEENSIVMAVETNEILNTEKENIFSPIEKVNISEVEVVKDSMKENEILQPAEEQIKVVAVNDISEPNVEHKMSTLIAEKILHPPEDAQEANVFESCEDKNTKPDNEKLFHERDEHFDEMEIQDVDRPRKDLEQIESDVFQNDCSIFDADNKDEDVFKQREESAIAFKNPDPPCSEIIEKITPAKVIKSVRNVNDNLPKDIGKTCKTFIDKEKEANTKEYVPIVKPKESRKEKALDLSVSNIPTTLTCSIDKSYFQHELCSRFLEQEKNYAARVNVADRSKVPKLVIRKSESNSKLSSKSKSFDVALEEISKREESNLKCKAHPKIPKMIIRNARSRPATPTIEEIANPTTSSNFDSEPKNIKVKIKVDDNGDACTSNQSSESEARVPKMKIKLEDRLPRVVIKSVDQTIINHELLKTVPKMKITNVKKSPKILDKQHSSSSMTVDIGKGTGSKVSSPSSEKSLKVKIRKDNSSDMTRKRSASSISPHHPRKIKRRCKEDIRQSIECTDPNLEDTQFLSDTEYKANKVRKSSVKIPKVIIKRTSPSAEFKCELSKDKKDAMIRAEKWQPQVILQRSWILDCMAKDLRHMKLAVKLGTPKKPAKSSHSNNEMEWRKFISGLKKRKDISKSNSTSNLCPIKVKHRRTSDYTVDYSNNSINKFSFENTNFGKKAAITDDEGELRNGKLNGSGSCWTPFDENMNSRSKVNLQKDQCSRKLDNSPKEKGPVNSNKSSVTKNTIEEKRIFPTLPDISMDETADESLLSKVVFASNTTATLNDFKLGNNSSVKIEACDDSQTILPISPGFSREGFDCEQLYSGDAIPTQFEFELEVMSASENAPEVPLENVRDGNVIRDDKEYEASVDEHDKSSTDISMPELGVEPQPDKLDLENRTSPSASPPDLSTGKDSESSKSSIEHFSHSDLLVKEVMAAKETLKKCLRNLKCDGATKFPSRPRTAAEKKQGSNLEPNSYPKCDKTLQIQSHRKELNDHRIKSDCRSRNNSETSKSKNEKQTFRNHSRDHSRTKHNETTIQSDKTPKDNNVSALRKFRKSNHKVTEKPKSETADVPKNDESKISTESSQKMKAYKIPKLPKTLNDSHVVEGKDVKTIEEMPVLEPHLTTNSDPNSDRDTPPVLTSPEVIIDPLHPKQIEEKIDRSDEDSNLQAKAKAISLPPEMSVNDIVKDLVFHNKATIKHRRYCTLCERWFPSTLRHQQHLTGYQHRHTELTQRRAIHMLFLLFTGKLCPRLLPPNVTRTDCVLGELTPLQVAVQDFAMVFDGMRESLSKKESEESKE